jgi:hypothetical protein
MIPLLGEVPMNHLVGIGELLLLPCGFGCNEDCEEWEWRNEKQLQASQNCGKVVARILTWLPKLTSLTIFC